MQSNLQADHGRIPVTALAFIHLRFGLQLLAGQGPFLRLYDPYIERPIVSTKCFDEENIHGFRVHPGIQVTESDKAQTRVLVWAGSSICLLNIESDANTDGQQAVVFKELIRTKADDWIQDALFSPIVDNDSFVFNAVFLTSHNVLYGLYQVSTSTTHPSSRANVKVIAVGPPNLLYSAHILWEAGCRGLVAAGTALGDVFIWSFATYQELLASHSPVTHILHCTLAGHDGSIFGVRIKKLDSSADKGPLRYLVATCSDDRTIRIWDVSGWDSLERTCNVKHDGNGIGNQIAIVQGHKSRIWGIQFLDGFPKSIRLVSYGEDRSSQIWTMKLSIGNGALDQSSSQSLLQHDATHTYHGGKNIWALDTVQENLSKTLVASGGADGGIVSYTLGAQDGSATDNLLTYETSIDNLRGSILEKSDGFDSGPDSPAAIMKPSHISKAVFMEMDGEWILARCLNSAIPTSPSGSLTGLATFRQRPPTDPNFDMEYLYIEEGTFTTEHSVSISATRRYVYRFKEDSCQISAWFVKPEDGSTVDYLFHVLDFQGITKPSNNIILKAHHLCNDDDYWVEYKFSLIGCILSGMSIYYTVKGPRKDYTANAAYTRSRDTVSAAYDTPSRNEMSSAAGIVRHRATANSELVFISNTDSFRSYVWVNEKIILVATDHGWLLQGEFSTKSALPCKEESNNFGEESILWTSIVQESNIRSPCIMVKSQGSDLVLIAGQDGTIYCFRVTTRSFYPLIELPGKVACLNTDVHDFKMDTDTPQRMTAFVSCLGSSIAYHLTIVGDQKRDQCNRIQLRLAPNLVPTSSLFIPSHMILLLGSRNGSLATYDLASAAGPVDPKLLTACLHGVETVTNIRVVPRQDIDESSDSIYFLTTGKDGRYAMHLLTISKSGNPPKQFDLQTVHACSLPFGPNVEGMNFDRRSKYLFLWGFRSKDFVVWNDSLKVEVLSVDCGGAHRNWAFLLRENANGGGNFIWTKASSLNVHIQPCASHNVLQRSGHGREIKAMALSPAVESSDSCDAQYLATGAEDTTIQIVESLCKNARSFGSSGCVTILSKHTAGIRQLCWSPTGRLLFSAAGREELFVWHARSVPFFGLGIICQSECPRVTEAGELRVMGIDCMDIVGRTDKCPGCIIGAVYSDSTLRIWHYDSFNRQSPFRLISVGKYTGYCLTQICFVRISSQVYCCTTSTDGHLACWSLDMEQDMQNHGAHPIDLYSEYQTSLGLIRVKNTLGFTKCIQVHHSSINSMVALELSDRDVLIATVGDDGALAFTRMIGANTAENSSVNVQKGLGKPTLDLPRTQHSALLIPKAHKSAIDALAYLSAETNVQSGRKEYRFATCGKDQRLKAWRLIADLRQPSTQGFYVMKEHNNHTVVADASSLQVLGANNREDSRLIVAGIGTEYQSLQKNLT